MAKRTVGVSDPVRPEVSSATILDPRWAAVAGRDRRFDGQFVSAVKTTGVYCRPSCPGRPKPQNVVFYATCEEAERAGFRACKRCRPTEARKPQDAARRPLPPQAPPPA